MRQALSTKRSARGGRLGPLLVCLLASLAVTAPAGRLAGDVVRLRNGNEIQGEILAETEEGVTLRFPGGTLRLKRKQIAGIERQPRAEYLVDEAEKACRREEFELAIASLRQARLSQPDSLRVRQSLVEAHRAHGAHLRGLKRLREALDAYGEILAIEPGDAAAVREIESIRREQGEAREDLSTARSLLSSGALEPSLERLEALYEEFPDLRGEVAADLAAARLRRGIERLESQDWPAAADLLHSVATLDPDRIEAVRQAFAYCQLVQIVPLVREGEFPRVEALARRGLDIDPANPQLSFFLALALEAKGDAREAVKIYASILDCDPPHPPEEHAAGLRREAEQRFVPRSPGLPPLRDPRSKEVLAGGFRELRTKHFVVKHRNPAIAADVGRAAERCYRDLFRRLGCRTTWRSPCEIVIHPTRDDYARETGQLSWTEGVHQLVQRRGALSEQRIESYQDQPGLTAGLLQHEIAHALLAHRLNYPPRIPLWANEGFAVLEGSGYMRAHYEKLLRQAKERRLLLPLADVTAAEGYPEGEALPLFYAQSFTLVRLLIDRRGLPAFISFLKDLAAGGVPLEGALRKHYRLPSITALESAWGAAL
ncbi:MAG: hypothetical protein JXA90_02610 [Planctomycetes bacterium]|nr:hypothetical protein [Planctomycetota bacterium]